MGQCGAVTGWVCGKCDGMDVAEHHRTCPCRAVDQVLGGPVVDVSKVHQLQRRPVPGRGAYTSTGTTARDRAPGKDPDAPDPSDDR